MDTAQKVVEYLIRQQQTIATMESCTSGLIASMITDTQGASAIFPGGLVTYANAVKIQMGVDADVIERYGVYSRECAQAMAQTVKQTFATDLAIGITGTTGNVDPNNADSVQGIAYYCILTPEQMYTYDIQIDVTNKSRHEIKQHYAEVVFERLAEVLQLPNAADS